jgi:hypothetical protein
MVFNPTRRLDFGSSENEDIPAPPGDVCWDEIFSESTPRDKGNSRVVRRAVSAISRSGLEVSVQCKLADLQTVMQTYGNLSNIECDKAISNLKMLNKWIIFANSDVVFPGDVSAAEIVREHC